MRKPIPWKEPTRLTVEAPNSRKRKQANPAGAGNGIGGEAPKLKRRRSAGSAVRKLAPTVRPRKANASLPLLMLLGHSVNRYASVADLQRGQLDLALVIDRPERPVADLAPGWGLASFRRGRIVPSVDA